MFHCLGCRKALVAPQDYVGHKVRCDSCDLAMLVPQKGGKPRIVDESSADTARGLPTDDPKMEEQEELEKLPRLETKKDMNVKKLRDSVKTSKKKMTETLTEEELLQTTEIEALSCFSVYAESSGQKFDEEAEDLPDVTELLEQEDTSDFRNLTAEEQSYLRPTKIQASKTIRGGRRPPRVVEKKKLSRKVLLILFVLFCIAAAWYFMNKDTGEFIRDAETTLSE